MNKAMRLTDPVPEWESKYVENKLGRAKSSFLVRALGLMENMIDKHLHPGSVQNTAQVLDCVDILIDREKLGGVAAVIGCGPKPDAILDLTTRGYRAVGVEPVVDALKPAGEYLAGRAEIVNGTAESTSLGGESQTLVLMENVLEHVDSVALSLSEAYRILKPGGILFVRTTNRFRFSLTGINWEFRTRFFNWFPRGVKESYVFAQLHYRPELAHYSPRPAVHWFSYPDLCEYGREAGFARFYSPWDLIYLTRRESTSAWRFRCKKIFHRNPWLRALMISQMVGDVFMWKRPGATD